MEITLFEIAPIWSKTAAAVNHKTSCRKLHIVKVRLSACFCHRQAQIVICVWQHFGKNPFRDRSFLIDQKQPRWCSRQTHQTPFTESVILCLKTHFIQTQHTYAIFACHQYMTLSLVSLPLHTSLSLPTMSSHHCPGHRKSSLYCIPLY